MAADITPDRVEAEVSNLGVLYSDPGLAPRKALPRADSMVRQPPASVECEQAVIGMLLLDPTKFWMVRTRVRAEDFYWAAHRHTFRIIGELATNSEAVSDIFAVIAHLDTHAGKESEEVDRDYLWTLINTHASAVNIEYYATQVADRAQLRGMIEIGHDLQNAAFFPDGKGAGEIGAEAMGRIERVTSGGRVAGRKMRAVLSDVITQVQQRYESGIEIIGIETPYPEMTEYLGGFQNGRLYYFGARAKMGKSIMLGDVALHAAVRCGKKVGRWDLEMGEMEVGYRSLASLSGVEARRIERAKLLEDDHWAALYAATATLRDAPITIFDEPGVSVEKIVAQATMLHARGELEIAVIDYLQIIGVAGSFERRDLAIGHITGSLKNMAKRLGIPVVVAGQINRGNEQGATVRPPRASDARESGNIEQDVDAMVLIHRPGYYDKTSYGARIEVALNRSGDTGVFRLEDDFAHSRFQPSDLQWVEDSGFQAKRQDRAGRKGDESGIPM